RVAAIHRKAALEREVSGDDVTQALQRVAPAEPLHALQAKPQLAQAVEQCLPDEILLGQLVLFEPANQLINHRQQFGLLILIKLRIGPNGPYQSRKSCKRRHLRRRKIMLERMARLVLQPVWPKGVLDDAKVVLRLNLMVIVERQLVGYYHEFVDACRNCENDLVEL